MSLPTPRIWMKQEVLVEDLASLLLLLLLPMEVEVER